MLCGTPQLLIYDSSKCTFEVFISYSFEIRLLPFYGFLLPALPHLPVCMPGQGQPTNSITVTH